MNRHTNASHKFGLALLLTGLATPALAQTSGGTRPTQNGQPQNGQAQQGQTQNGQMQNGQMQNGQMQNGQMQNGQTSNGSMQNGNTNAATQREGMGQTQNGMMTAPTRQQYDAADRRGYDRLVQARIAAYDQNLASYGQRQSATATGADRAEQAYRTIQLRRQRDDLNRRYFTLGRASDADYTRLRQQYTDDLTRYDATMGEMGMDGRMQGGQMNNGQMQNNGQQGNGQQGGGSNNRPAGQSGNN